MTYRYFTIKNRLYKTKLGILEKYGKELRDKKISWGEYLNQLTLSSKFIDNVHKID
ncbi:MAG: hypothetical protein ACFFC1_06235 [Promethearchaeota archaeon]